MKTAKEYEKAHAKLFNTPDVLTCSQEGRFSGGEGRDGMWTYLIWGKKRHNVAHEVAHAVLHVFERCGIDPREGNGEPFCYMLSQLLLEAPSNTPAADSESGLRRNGREVRLNLLGEGPKGTRNEN